ncbi:hypothetical protein C5745_13160 [Sphingobacterium haloxyli]|uniref:Polysaccharide biosynthesis protein n=2 Tax=Sphingobacterium haloxyli TaxID=2100533 RepID=A0A2S9J203_9SPHI|nr:hypothetical protein C5745_13160 [Sphingobacterium haloxyli]
MGNFLKAFLSFGLATSIEKILGFILLPIYTRYFSTEVYGVIDMMSTGLAIGIVFSLLQLETSLQRYYYQYSRVKRSMMVTNIYGTILLFSILIGSLIFLFSKHLSVYLFATGEYANLFLFVGIQLPLANLSMLGLILLRFEGRNKDFLKVILLKVVLNLVFAYLFVVLGEDKLGGVFYAQILSLAFSTLLVTFYVKSNFVVRFSPLLQIKAFKYALPQLPARLGSMMLAQANRFFMLGYLSLSTIGLYSVSLKLASSVQIINSAFIMAWTPFMHKQFQNKNNKVVFKHVLPLLSAIVFLGVSLIALYSREIVLLVTSEPFYGSYRYVGGLALFFAFYIIKEVVDIGPKITEKTIYLSYVFFVSVVVNLTTLYFFTESFDLMGVVASMIITNFVLVVGAWFVSNILYPIDFSWKRFLLLLIPCMAIVFFILLDGGGLVLRSVISIGVLLYYGLFFKEDYYKVKKVLS